MDSLFHFVFPIMAALAARVHTKHPVRNIVLAGILAVALDLDHFFGMGLERALFHNIFITILFPIVLIVLAFNLKTKNSTKGFAILLLIFLSSQTFLDLFTEYPGVALLFPFSKEYYFIDLALYVPINSIFASHGAIISSYGIGLLLYLILILLPCLFLDKIIEKMEKKHESFSEALEEIMKL